MQEEPEGPWKPKQGRGGEDVAALQETPFNHQMETATVEISRFDFALSSEIFRRKQHQGNAWSG